MKLFAAALVGLVTAMVVFAADERDGAPEPQSYAACDPGEALSAKQRSLLLFKLAGTSTGRTVLGDFRSQFGGYRNLLIQWDTVSYSQVVGSPADASARVPARSPASASDVSATSKLGSAVCIHLTHRLPEIEHLADLAHELAHATRLTPEVLRGEVATSQEFVKARLTARGGEADAFNVECHVKSELLGRWDELCSPYADGNGFDTARVVKDLYNGRLSASLTGETYPVMLARQFKAMLAKRTRLQYASDPYARK